MKEVPPQTPPQELYGGKGYEQDLLVVIAYPNNSYRKLVGGDWRTARKYKTEDVPFLENILGFYLAHTCNFLYHSFLNGIYNEKKASCHTRI